MNAKLTSEPSLAPDCVRRVLMHIEWLENAALAEFPDLDRAPISHQEARSVIERAAAWGRAVHDACERQSYPNCVTKDGESLRFGLFEISQTGGSLVYPRDVMGEPPPSLQQACQADALVQLAPGGMNDIEARGLDLVADWSAIREVIRNGHGVIRSQTQQAISWARSRAQDIHHPGQAIRSSPMDTVSGGRGAWSSQRTGGAPLRGWASICKALSAKSTPARQRALRRMNAASQGPIRTVASKPEADEGELLAWMGDMKGREEAIRRARELEDRAAAEVRERSGLHAQDLNMHVAKAPSGSRVRLGKARRR